MRLVALDLILTFAFIAPALNDRFLADLLDRIRTQKPIAIGLDIVRDVSVPPGTEELNEIFRTTPNLIGVGIIGSLEDAYSHDIAFPPILKAKGQVGDVSGTIDVDRVVRRGVIYPLQDGSEESKIPALSLKMAYEYLKLQKIEPTASSEGWLQLKDTVFYPYKQEEEGYQIIINWRNNFPLKVSVADVIEGKLPKNFFQDKLVFVGGTSLSLKDIFETPFGQRYGVEIQATIASVVISSVLDGRGLIRGMDKKERIADFEPRLTIITEKEGETIVIRIADNGLGISEEDKKNIFNPFFSTRKKKQGTGLGLYFVWEIVVNEHGGTISVESIEGEGAEFVVTIPVKF
jgi:CHASE2 domain-containing sensor protein